MIYLGTSSWHFEGWRDTFYPSGLTTDQYLQYYSRQFRAVEVNTSFYGLPRPSTLIKWVEDVPEGFQFCLKFPRTISHEKRLVGCEAETLALLDTLRALGNSAGPAFLQLPPSLTREVGGLTIANYLDWLAEVRGDLRIAVEVRAEDLMTSRFAGFLAERNMALVLADRVGAPDLYDVWMSARQSVAFVFVRWIGDARNGPQGDRELELLRDQELETWAERVATMSEAGLTVFGFMHNPYEGHAPASVARMRRQLSARIDLPAWPPDSSDDIIMQMPLL